MQTGRLIESMVYKGTCDVCDEKLKQRVLTNEEFHKLAASFSSYFQRGCRRKNFGSMAEFYALQKMIAYIKQRQPSGYLAFIV